MGENAIGVGDESLEPTGEFHDQQPEASQLEAGQLEQVPEPPKRKRGRPRKSDQDRRAGKGGRAASGPEDPEAVEAAGISLEVEEAPSRGKRQPPVQDAAAGFLTATDAAKSAAALLDTLNVLAISFGGPGAAMQPTERMLVQPALARSLRRVKPQAFEKLGGVADPLLMGTGLMLWGMRVVKGGGGIQLPSFTAPTPAPEATQSPPAAQETVYVPEPPYSPPAPPNGAYPKREIFATLGSEV